ncbi:U6 snRNA phosphodiesterase Usb1 [Daldinia eschscholtzii]|nr:U6 snRNA phosphodiesterase Usb1 [Daldinia eschscholtzii]
MALVDYSSDSESEAGEAVTTKRQKTSHDKTLEDSAALPPLPDAFHDLYASTVRVSTSDDPTLHQGRKRVNPHRVGSWPSHLYTEWHPTPSQRTILSTLLSDLQTALAPLSVDIKSFLTSDLGAPQPLHISLSRPIVLSTADKDDFLEKLISRVKSSGIGPFDLTPRGLEWHRTSESERSFLVLRVGSTASTTGHVPVPAAGRGESKKRKGKGGESSPDVGPTSTQQQQEQQQRHNPELAALLQQCNALVQEHQQPPLYAFSGSGTDGISDDDAFHISIAWSFAPPSPDVKRYTERAFAAGPRAEVLAMRVPVRGVKAKIGNVITPVELPVRGKKGA